MMSTTIKTATVIFLIILPMISGIGVAPSSNDFYSFDANAMFKVINDNDDDSRISLSIQGPLSDYVSLDENAFIFSEGEKFRTIHYSLNAPPQLSPGLHESGIIITTIPKREGTLSSATRIIHKIRLHVPVKGEYAEPELFIGDFQKEKIGNFNIKVRNLGDSDISASANLVVSDGKGKTYDIASEQKNIREGEQKILSLQWSPETEGQYLVRGNIEYSGKMKSIPEKAFFVGTPSLRITNISPEKFSPGKIMLLNYSLSSNWNRRITAKAIIFLKNSSIRYESGPFIVRPLEQANLIAYIDTSEIRNGNYTLVSRLIHEKIDTYEVPMRIIDNQVIIMDNASPVEKQESRFLLYLIISAILLTFLSLWIIMRIRNKR